MKSFSVIASSLAALILLIPPVLAQELPTAEKREGATYYVVLYTKFKHGKGDEAREIIYEHFWPTDKAIGRDVIPFDTMTGEWDHVVYFPLSDGPAELAWEMSPTEEKWTAAFAKQVGGMDKVEEIFQRFSDLVATSKTEIVMTKWSNSNKD